MDEENQYPIQCPDIKYTLLIHSCIRFPTVCRRLLRFPPKKGIKSWKVFNIPGASAILKHIREATL